MIKKLIAFWSRLNTFEDKQPRRRAARAAAEHSSGRVFPYMYSDVPDNNSVIEYLFGMGPAGCKSYFSCSNHMWDRESIALLA